MLDRIPHPANVPGDFYVVENCCTMCEVPFIEAPELFGTFQHAEGYPHCFVKRQPEGAAELDRMIRTIRCAEFQCIRYRGSDRLIQLRLIEQNEGIVCDGLPPELQREADRQEAERQRAFQEFRDSRRSTRRRPWWRFW